MNFLFRIAGFFPYLCVLFLNAFVDLGHKIIIQNTVFKTYDGQEQIILTSIVNALILLPFILMFTPAGFLSDKYPKNKVMRISAIVAVVLTLLITLFYHLGWFWAAFGMTFLLASQSAIYSPAKFGYIKELVGTKALAAANGLVQAITMIAILTGTFVFSILFEKRLDGIIFLDESMLIKVIAPIGWGLVAMSVIELIFAYRLPNKQIAANTHKFDWQRYRTGSYLKDNLHVVYRHPVIWLAIIGLSIFWAISQVVLATFPAFAKETLNTVDTVLIQGMMACAGIGVMLGSIMSGKLSKKHIETGLLPIGAFGVAVTLMIMPLLNTPLFHALNFLALGFMGGLFVVPLNALIQFHAKEQELGVVLAANNLIQTSVMLTFLITTILLAHFGLSAVGVISLLMIVALAGAIYTLSHLPQSFARLMLGRLLKSKYRLHVIGFDHIPENGGVLMLGNHISFIDWAILQVACPRHIHFVMAKNYYDRWYLRWFFDLFGAIPIRTAASKEALRAVTVRLNAGQVVCLFPEGAISRNGQLAEFKPGYERAAAGANALILPFHLRGLWGSRFSRSSELLKRRRQTGVKRDLVVSFAEPMPINTKAASVKNAVQHLSMQSWQSAAAGMKTIPEMWLTRPHAMDRQLAIKDTRDRKLKHQHLLKLVILFAQAHKQIKQGDRIGVLSDRSPSISALITNLAIWLRGGIVVNLDPTLSQEQLNHCLDQAEIKTIFLETKTDISPPSNIQSIDIESALNSIQKNKAFFLRWQISLLPRDWLIRLYNSSKSADDVASIIFKKDNLIAVPLTHRNLMINVKQLAHVLNTIEHDRILCNQPLHSAFGLTVTFLLPLIEGVPIVCHAKADTVINTARAIAHEKITLMCTDSNMLESLTESEKVHSLMLRPLRMVITSHAFLDQIDQDKKAITLHEKFKLKFNQDVYVGFGVTEASPAVSVNVMDKLDPDDFRVQIGHKPDSVGLALPGTLIKIDAGSNEIRISGPQLTQGYLNQPDLNAEKFIDEDNTRWFRTEMSGSLDEDGFLYLINNY